MYASVKVYRASAISLRVALRIQGLQLKRYTLLYCTCTGVYTGSRELVSR